LIHAQAMDVVPRIRRDLSSANRIDPAPQLFFRVAGEKSRWYNDFNRGCCLQARCGTHDRGATIAMRKGTRFHTSGSSAQGVQE